MLAGLQDRLIRELQLGPGMRVLDAGSGPGTQALALAQAVPGVSVVGVDASHVMIQEAVRRAGPRPRVSFEVAEQSAEFLRALLTPATAPMAREAPATAANSTAGWPLSTSARPAARS